LSLAVAVVVQLAVVGGGNLYLVQVLQVARAVVEL
jgi:hypothetical protein